MHAIISSYTTHGQATRLVLACGGAILLNALYCLAYRYASGNPATLFEAFSWGTINIAPWIAAMELGRTLRSTGRIAALIVAAFALSLTLEIIVELRPPDMFELVRRLPGALATIAFLAGLALFRARERAVQPDREAQIADLRCAWARSAGNYVELHDMQPDGRSGNPRLVRETLSHVTATAGSNLIRIHRQYAVAPGNIKRIERSHVLLEDGVRLPIGNRYRDQLAEEPVFVPSSQSA